MEFLAFKQMHILDTFPCHFYQPWYMLVTGQSRVKAELVVFLLVATILASMNGLQGPSRTA